MDGFDEPYWNYIQVMAWVYLGDRDLVRRASDEVTDHGAFWQQLTLADGRREWVETPSHRPDPIRLYLTAAWNGGGALPSYEAAEDAVLTALRDGRLHGLGLRNNRGDLEEIPTPQLAQVKFYYDPRKGGYAAPRDHFRSGATHWYGVKFSRAEVMAIWLDPLAGLAERLKAPQGESDSKLEQHPPSTRKRGRRARAKESALRSLADLYPNGIPNTPWKTITAEVNAWLRNQDEMPVSDDTVRRAASEL